MSHKPLKRVVWRRASKDGTPRTPATKTALRPHEEENVRAAARLLHRRLKTWRVVSQALGIARKTIDRVMSGERRVQDRWAILIARALVLTVDDVISGSFRPEHRRAGLKLSEWLRELALKAARRAD